MTKATWNWNGESFTERVHGRARMNDAAGASGMTLTTLPAHLMPMVEKAARRIFNASCGGLLPDWVEESKWNEAIAIAEADALAFLNACLDGGVAINGHYVDKFHKTSPALILTLGEAK